MSSSPEQTRSSKPAADDPELRDLFPQLTRFYGLSFFELMAMPRWAIRIYAEALDVLSARERLDAIEASAFPHMSESDASDLQGRYLDVVNAGIAADAPPLVDPGAFGIEVVRARRDGAVDNDALDEGAADGLAPGGDYWAEDS